MMINEPPSDYRREGDTFLIEPRLHDPRQLFNSLDPAPFHEKDLDDDAERYIVDAAGEFALNTISGRVAMWQPLQIFLYDWWPIRRRWRIFARLAALPIEVRRP